MRQVAFLISAVALLALVTTAYCAEDGVIIETTKAATLANECAAAGDRAVVHYVGRLTDANGKIFDSSRRRSQPFEFLLGEGRVIPAWEVAVNTMCIGEIRNVIAPPSMAYGDEGYPPTIPPKATLWFEIELLAIVPGANHANKGWNWEQISIIIPFVVIVGAVMYAGFRVLLGNNKAQREKVDKVKRRTLVSWIRSPTNHLRHSHLPKHMSTSPREYLSRGGNDSPERRGKSRSDRDASPEREGPERRGEPRVKQDAGFTSARAVSSPLYIKVYVFDKGAVQSSDLVSDLSSAMQFEIRTWLSSTLFDLKCLLQKAYNEISNTSTVTFYILHTNKNGEKVVKEAGSVKSVLESFLLSPKLVSLTFRKGDNLIAVVE